MARSTFVYVTYIRTTPEKLWSALTDVEYMKQYWFGVHCESQWTAGSSWKMVSGDGQITEWNGGQALHHPHHRARTLEIHCGGVRRLAEDHLQPEVPAGDRLHRSA
jgi:uncharacterized protein YndB with AHSA1/START domain